MVEVTPQIPTSEEMVLLRCFMESSPSASRQQPPSSLPNQKNHHLAVEKPSSHAG